MRNDREAQYIFYDDIDDNNRGECPKDLLKFYEEKKRTGCFYGDFEYDLFKAIQEFVNKQEQTKKYKMQLEVPFELGQQVFYVNFDKNYIEEKTIERMKVEYSVKSNAVYTVMFSDRVEGIWDKNTFDTKKKAAECLLKLSR